MCRYCDESGLEHIKSFQIKNNNIDDFTDLNQANHSHDHTITYFIIECNCGNITLESNSNKCWCGWRGSLNIGESCQIPG